MDPSPRSCDTCGAANLAQAKFCSACGQAMSAATSSPPSAHTAAADSEPAPTALPVGTLLYTYRGHASHAPPLSVHAVAWSPDSRRIASADIDGTVQIWDAADGSHLSIYHGHATAYRIGVHAVGWSPDGQRIASAGADWTVQVWAAG